MASVNPTEPAKDEDDTQSARISPGEIWANLGSPRYICAPMVEMSELSFRTLARRHGTQLCFTPMFHAAKFVRDPIYRSQMFITCPEDRPLIVQFCANDPEIFAEAAALVQDDCDGVDLNLGCPQTIAKRGHYGSFLQDDWLLVHEMVQCASQRVRIPISCKLRILPDLQKTIAYALMMEQAGAKFLTVHGRTREQKGHATGLADWDALKAIKSSVSVPVVANGNIVNFADVERCLAYTGCDGVMSAEGILQNPALFSGKNPPVWEIVEEYLELCRTYPTDHGHIRTHLFRMLAQCLPHFRDIQEDLAKANSSEECASICAMLWRKLEERRTATEGEPCEQKHREVNSTDTPPHLVSSTGICENMDAPHGEAGMTCDSDTLYGKGECHLLPRQPEAAGDVELCGPAHPVMGEMGSDAVAHHPDHHEGRDEEASGEQPPLYKDQLESQVHTSVSTSVYELPIWLCHARPRVSRSAVQTGTMKKRPVNQSEAARQEAAMAAGVQAMSLAEGDKADSLLDHKRLPRSQKKKLKIQQRLEGQKLRRQKTRQQKKERKRMKQLQEDDVVKDEEDAEAEPRVSKREKMDLVRERCLAAMTGGQRVCVDLSMECLMSQKECSKLAQQLCRLYGSNRKSKQPLHIYLTGLEQDGFLHQECRRKCQGFNNYLIDVHYVPHTEVFSPSEIVYLSPDSPTVLETVEQDEVYIIGGLIDESIQKGVTQGRAEKSQVRTARLPIDEYMQRTATSGYNFKKVLAVNQVFDILMTYKITQDWRCALQVGMPPRQGYVLRKPEEATSSQGADAQVESCSGETSPSERSPDADSDSEDSSQDGEEEELMAGV